MNASELLVFSTENIIPHAIDFNPLDRYLGFILPDDYKDILTCFGPGAFGELVLFHPLWGSVDFRLPDAVFSAHKCLHGFMDFAAAPSLEFSILGYLSPRRYLIYQHLIGWSFFDSEYEELCFCGRDLRRVIMSAYKSGSLAESADSALGKMIWLEDEDSGFPLLPFFSKYRGVEPIGQP